MVNKASLFVLIMVLGFVLTACAKGVTPADCNSPYIFVKDECCLDRNENGQCDYNDQATAGSEAKTIPSSKESGGSTLSEEEQATLEERKQILEEAKAGYPTENELLGYFPDWFDGQKYPIYPSKYYRHFDDLFKDFDRSIILQGKQCHVTDVRIFKPTEESVYFWRPLPIPCNEKKDCEIYAAKDPKLKNAVMFNAVYSCLPYQKGCCE